MTENTEVKKKFGPGNSKKGREMSTPETSNRRTELTVKQRTYIKGRAEGLNKRDAALAAGIDPRNANKVEVSKNVTNALEEMLRQKGIDDASLAQTIFEGLQATKPVVVEGVINDYNDYAVRKQYVDVVLDVTGKRAKKQVDVTTNGKELPENNVTINNFDTAKIKGADTKTIFSALDELSANE